MAAAPPATQNLRVDIEVVENWSVGDMLQITTPIGTFNFVVPEGVAWRVGTSDQWEDLTTVSKMAGEGQIAQFGYKDPQFVPVSVYVFDRGGEGQPQRFGVHWLSLEGLSIFERLESEDIEKATHLMNSNKLEL